MLFGEAADLRQAPWPKHREARDDRREEAVGKGELDGGHGWDVKHSNCVGRADERGHISRRYSREHVHSRPQIEPRDLVGEPVVPIADERQVRAFRQPRKGLDGLSNSAHAVLVVAGHDYEERIPAQAESRANIGAVVREASQLGAIAYHDGPPAVAIGDEVSDPLADGHDFRSGAHARALDGEIEASHHAPLEGRRLAALDDLGIEVVSIVDERDTLPARCQPGLWELGVPVQPVEIGRREECGIPARDGQIVCDRQRHPQGALGSRTHWGRYAVPDAAGRPDGAGRGLGSGCGVTLPCPGGRLEPKGEALTRGTARQCLYHDRVESVTGERRCLLERPRVPFDSGGRQ